MTTLTTVRLILREFIESDWPAVHQYASDPAVVKHMTWGPNSEEETRNFIRRAIAFQKEQPRRKNYELAVVLRNQDLLIGGCGLRISDEESHEASIGYILHREFWGRGYATEAATALLQFGFDHLHLHRIFATCDPANRTSVKVLEKIGMRREALLQRHKRVKGRWRDSLLFAIPGRDRWRRSLKKGESRVGPRRTRSDDQAKWESGLSTGRRS